MSNRAIHPAVFDDAAFAALGERMAADPSKIETGLEGFAYRHHQYLQKLKRIERDGCCGGTPMADGVCFGVGMCPLKCSGK